ncbi:hypothetical protein NDU88_003359 [Pleurodeles waltl]|uniref:Uncharacterized protein n=1 Tax=Pleurodeles waltl TaxID=8319 RepID=A0AAV7NG73_PLEWA|nr:hypothetical protein NDU88_003359 [Pleurodeles waltl]
MSTFSCERTLLTPFCLVSLRSVNQKIKNVNVRSFPDLLFNLHGHTHPQTLMLRTDVMRSNNEDKRHVPESAADSLDEDATGVLASVDDLAGCCATLAGTGAAMQANAGNCVSFTQLPVIPPDTPAWES